MDDLVIVLAQNGATFFLSMYFYVFVVYVTERIKRDSHIAQTISVSHRDSSLETLDKCHSLLCKMNFHEPDSVIMHARLLRDLAQDRFSILGVDFLNFSNKICNSSDLGDQLHSKDRDNLVDLIRKRITELSPTLSTI